MAQPGDRRGLVFAALVVMHRRRRALPDACGRTPSEPAAGQAPAAAVTTSSRRSSPSTPLATASDAPFDVYAYLPMSKQQLAAAADLAERFTAEYGTFRHDEDPAAYAAG